MKDPVGLGIAWLRTAAGLAGTPITRHLAADTALPAVVVPGAAGGPVLAAHGITAASEWLLTVYCVAGKTGKGKAYPDTEAAHALASAIVAHVATLNGGARWTSADGATIATAQVLTTGRTVDAAGNARATLTLRLRVLEV